MLAGVALPVLGALHVKLHRAPVRCEDPADAASVVRACRFRRGLFALLELSAAALHSLEDVHRRVVSCGGQRTSRRSWSTRCSRGRRQLFCSRAGERFSVPVDRPQHAREIRRRDALFEQRLGDRALSVGFALCKRTLNPAAKLGRPAICTSGVVSTRHSSLGCWGSGGSGGDGGGGSSSGSWRQRGRQRGTDHRHQLSWSGCRRRSCSWLLVVAAQAHGRLGAGASQARARAVCRWPRRRHRARWSRPGLIVRIEDDGRRATSLLAGLPHGFRPVLRCGRALLHHGIDRVVMVQLTRANRASASDPLPVGEKTESRNWHASKVCYLLHESGERRVSPDLAVNQPAAAECVHGDADAHRPSGVASV